MKTFCVFILNFILSIYISYAQCNLPTGSIAGSNFNVCQGNPPVNVVFTGAGGLSPYTFSYTLNGGATKTITTTAGSSTTTLSVSTNNNGTFRYDLTAVQDATGCSQNQVGTVWIDINPSPTATIAGTTTICVNGLSPIITFTGSNGTPPYTFTYNLNGGPNQTVSTTTGNSATLSVPTNTPGTYTYSLIGVATNTQVGCQSQFGSATVMVSAFPLSGNVIAPTIVCQNASSFVVFTGNNGLSPYTFTYNINGSLTQTISSVGNNSSVNIPINTSSVGSYTYSLLSISDINNCYQTQTGSVIVLVTATPVISIVANPLTVCSGNQVTLTATGANTYTWVSISNLSTTNGTSITSNPALTSTYSVTGTDINGCKNSSSTIVTTLSNQSVSATSAKMCMGSTTTLNAFGANSYTWTPATGLNSIYGSSVITTTSLTTTYTVTGTTNNCGSSSAVSIVTVYPLPKGTVVSGTGCMSNTAILEGYNGTPPYFFTYQFNNNVDSLPATISNIATIYPPNNISYGNYNCSLIKIKDANNCISNLSGQITTNIKIIPKPNAIFTIDPQQTNLFESTISIYNNSIAADTWQWDFGDGGTALNDNPRNHSYVDTGTYKVTLVATNSVGCNDSSYQYVSVKPPIVLYIPNTFTPNGDGINDFFQPQGDFILKYQMIIYDRWGNSLFYTDDINNGWDGIVKNNNGLAATDTYVYIVDIKAMSNKHDYTYRGSFNLVR